MACAFLLYLAFCLSFLDLFCFYLSGFFVLLYLFFFVFLVLLCFFLFVVSCFVLFLIICLVLLALAFGFGAFLDNRFGTPVRKREGRVVGGATPPPLLVWLVLSFALPGLF